MNRLMPDKASSNTRLSVIISRGEFLAPREDTTGSVEPVGLEEPQVQDAVAAGEMQEKVKVSTDLIWEALVCLHRIFEMKESEQTSQTTWTPPVPSRQCWTDDAPLQLGEPNKSKLAPRSGCGRRLHNN
ncbi:hypothetical protein BDW62DRAFT_180934 [Aspergillus aurantiobrunneus]